MGVPNRYDLTVCGHSETWTVEKWREAYGFVVGGKGFVSKINKFVGRKFRNLVNPKDGFAIVYCEDERAKRVLEFLILILYHKKPTQITVTVGNTIFGALLGEWKVDWGIILQSIVAKLVENALKHNAILIRPYLFHMYVEQEVLLLREIVAYNIGLDLLKYN